MNEYTYPRLTAQQHRSLIHLLNTVPTNSVKRIYYGIGGHDDRVRITLGNGTEYNSHDEDTGDTRTLHILSDGKITERQDVEVRLP